MAGKSDAMESAVLRMIFNNDVSGLMAAIGSGLQASTTAGSLYVALHTGADPTDAMTGTTNEISYTGYARATVARTGWVVSGTSPTQIVPAANIDFGQMTAGAGGTVTYFSINTASSGAGNVLYYGAVSPNISVVNGVIPRLTTATAITED